MRCVDGTEGEHNLGLSGKGIRRTILKRIKELGSRKQCQERELSRYRCIGEDLCCVDMTVKEGSEPLSEGSDPPSVQAYVATRARTGLIRGG